MNKLLLIVYYFPPCGGAAVQRWLRFVPQLVNRGWQVTVISPASGDYPFEDSSLLQKIPDQVKIIKTKTFSLNRLWKVIIGSKESIPYGSLEITKDSSLLKRLLIWLRVNLIIPDMRVFWNPFAYRAAVQELSKDRYDLVITSGPPHSTHLVGLKLQQMLKISWVADFRDPWSTIHYLQMRKPTKLSFSIHRYMESQVLKMANLSLVVSEPIADKLPEGNKMVLLNGYDATDFVGLEYSPTSEFRIKYVGQVTTGQDIQSLLQAFKRFLTEYNAKFSFVGTKLSKIDLIRSNEVIPDLEVVSFVSHKMAIEEMVNSELLIIIINDTYDNMGIITTKLFEYIGSKTPILCIGPAGSEAEKIVTLFDSGKCFTSPFDSGVLIYLEDLFQKWSTANAVRNVTDISPLSVQKQIDKLDESLRRVMSARK
jgi:glycosyltransferase involved in cell wall biosynthesis